MTNNHERSAVHALRSESRLLTTPKMIDAFTLRGVLSVDEVTEVLAEMVDERGRRVNPYVTRFLNRFES